MADSGTEHPTDLICELVDRLEAASLSPADLQKLKCITADFAYKVGKLFESKASVEKGSESAVADKETVKKLYLPVSQLQIVHRSEYEGKRIRNRLADNNIKFIGQLVGENEQKRLLGKRNIQQKTIDTIRDSLRAMGINPDIKLTVSQQNKFQSFCDESNGIGYYDDID